MNLLLHEVEQPKVIRTNSLAFRWPTSARPASTSF